MEATLRNVVIFTLLGRLDMPSLNGKLQTALNLRRRVGMLFSVSFENSQDFHYRNEGKLESQLQDFCQSLPELR